MSQGQHEKPEPFIRESWWKAGIWEALLVTGGALGLTAGAVAGFYLCLLTVDGGERQSKYQFPLLIAFALLGCLAGVEAAKWIVRWLRGPSGQEPVESSGETGFGAASPLSERDSQHPTTEAVRIQKRSEDE